jgi:hypothetical protein
VNVCESLVCRPYGLIWQRSCRSEGWESRVAQPWRGKGAGLEVQRSHGADQQLRRPMGWVLACSTSYSFSIWWRGEAFHELGVQRADVSAFPGVLPQSSMSPAPHQSPWITEVRRSVAPTHSLSYEESW